MDLADLLECSICLEQLDESNKVLPCQHTFCTKCLKDIFHKKSELLCPECRKPVEVPIDALPPNILANRILEGMTRKTSTTPHRPSDILKPQPALPLPKRPAAKPEMSRKPPAITPEVTDKPEVPVGQDKTGHYSNITPIKKPNASQQMDSQSIIVPTSVKQQTIISSSTSPGCPQTISPPPVLASPIPGNHSTNPFLDLIQSEENLKDLSKSISGISVSSAKAPSNLLTPSNDQNLIQSLPLPVTPAPRPPASNLHQPSTSDPPKVPERPKHTLISLESTKLWQLSPRALIQPLKEQKPPNPLPSSSSSSTINKGSLYKSVFDYSAKQADELSIKKGEFYSVSEICVDGWYKGQSLRTGKTGVFPGNHVAHVEHGVKGVNKTRKNKDAIKKSNQEVNLIDLSDEEGRREIQKEGAKTETDEERLEKLKKIRDTLKQNHQQNVVRAQAGASSGHIKTKGDRYRCTVAFPASSEYEIDLQVGDVISLVKRRDDGWCKGTLHRTGKTGLFPASFVEKI